MPKILGDKRTKEIKIRLTDNEFAKLQQRRTKNLAGWLRDLALGAVPIRPRLKIFKINFHSKTFTLRPLR